MQSVYMETIASTPYGFNPFKRASSSSLHLITETVDVNGNGRRFAYRIQAPDFFKKLFLGEHFIRMFCQEIKQVKFLTG